MKKKIEPKVLPMPELRPKAEPVQAPAGSVEELFRRGEGRFNANDDLGAIEDMTAVLAREPKHRDAFMLRGRAAYQMSDYDAAVRDFSAVLELRASPVAYFNRGLTKFYKGDPAGARADFLLAPDEVFKLAEQRFKDGQYAAAISDLGVVLEAGPARLEAVKLRGLAHYRLGDYRSAILDFSRALELDAHPVTYYNRGTAELKIAEFQSALRDFDAAIALRDTDKDFFWDRGLAKEALGDAAGARSDFTRSLDGPSERRKNEIESEIRADRSAAARYAAAGTLAWAAFVPFLPALTPGRFWYFLFPGLAVAYLQFEALELYLKSKGLKPIEDASFPLGAALALLGPAIGLPAGLWISSLGNRCRVCATDAPRSAKSCRRCAAPV